MKRLSLVFAAAVLLQAQAPSAQPLYTCGPGAVRGVRAVADTPTLLAGEDLPAASTGSPMRYVVDVALDGAVYTGVSPADHPWNLDPADFGPGEAVSVCASRTDFVLDRGDGTDFRARVVQVSRQPGLQPERLTGAGQPRPVPQRVARESRQPSSTP